MDIWHSGIQEVCMIFCMGNGAKGLKELVRNDGKEGDGLWRAHSLSSTTNFSLCISRVESEKTRFISINVHNIHHNPFAGHSFSIEEPTRYHLVIHVYQTMFDSPNLMRTPI